MNTEREFERAFTFLTLLDSQQTYLCRRRPSSVRSSRPLEGFLEDR